MSFAENLKKLPGISHLAAVNLLDKAETDKAKAKADLPEAVGPAMTTWRSGSIVLITSL